MDYYSILGVAKTASPDEIKTAYRKLAKEHHPDRTGGDDSQFKKINEAYDTLKDTARRQQYDNPQQQFRSQDFNGQHPFEDIFNQMFGQRMRQTSRNRDIQVQCDITLKEVVTGGTRIIQYRLPSGTEQTVEVEIPLGIKTGQRTSYRNLGDDSISNAPKGNLHVIFNVINNTSFEVNGNDIYYTVVINIFELLLGKEIIIETISGKNLKLHIKPKTNPQSILSIPHEGLPIVNTTRRGNLYIKFKTVIPDFDETHASQLSKIYADLSRKNLTK